MDDCDEPGSSAGWTISEQIDEMRAKLHLKERDLRAYYESSEAKKKHNEENILALRQKNKNKRIALAKSINGDEKVIQEVFSNRNKEDLLCMKRYTVAEAIEEMDQRMCEASKQLSELEEHGQQKVECIKQLRWAMTDMDNLSRPSKTDQDGDRRVRQLQNDLDKAQIKFEAARNITCRYEQILERMQEECRSYPRTLDALEQSLKETRFECKELAALSEKAKQSSEHGRRDLMNMEKDTYRAKKTRDQLLNKTRKEVERRREPVERPEKKTRVVIGSQETDGRGRQSREQSDRQETILDYEEAFDRIKDAIKVSEIKDILFRFSIQDNTQEHLRFQEKEKLQQRRRLQDELTRLSGVFHHLKYTSEGRASEGRKVLEEMQSYTIKQEERRDAVNEKLRHGDNLLMDLQAAVSTVYQKLWDIKLKPPFHNFSRGDPSEDLANCGTKLSQLMNEIGPEYDMSTMMHKLHTIKFHDYLEGIQPSDNMRIKIETEDSDIDDFHFDHDQDNEGMLNREDIKRIGQDMIESKQKKPKKKKKKRNQ